MGQKIKGVIAVLAVLLTLSLFLTIQMNNARQLAEREREELKKENETLSLKVSESESENASLKEKLASLEKESETVSRAKEALQKKYSLLDKERTQLEERVKTLTAQLQNVSGLPAALEKKILEMQKENARLQEKISSLDTALKEKILQISNVRKELEAKTAVQSSTEAKKEVPEEKKTAVELAPIVVKPQSENLKSTASLPTFAQIVSVNRENNFVVIDQGQDSGIKVGQTFQVFQKDQPVATIKTIQLRRSLAACEIRRESSPIAIGDAVR